MRAGSKAIEQLLAFIGREGAEEKVERKQQQADKKEFAGEIGWG